MGDFEKLTFNDVVVLVVNLSRGTMNEAKQLGNLLDKQIVSGCKKVIVDLEKCEFIDSTFIGTLVLRYKKLNKKGGKLKLIIPDKQQGVLFAVTNTLRFFDKFESRKEAIESFQ
jgi:anti-sigma B factor antagonist